MKKRLFRLMLCLAMLVAVFPALSAPAAAANDIPLGTYTNADYSSSVTLKADLTFSFVMNFGEGFATATGTYYTWDADDGSTVATLKVTSRHTGIVVNDIYNFSGTPKQDGQLYLTDGNAGIVPTDTVFTLKEVIGNSGPTGEQITAGRGAIAAAVKSNNGKFAAAHKTAVSSGRTYTGYRGAALDSWAVKEVGIADAMNLMPTEVNDYFQEPITRGDFAALVHSALMRMTGLTESQLKASVTPGSFPDSSDDKVKVCAGLGIITGYDTGKFMPEKTITRQEAAAMLSRLAETIGAKATTSASSFNDISGLWGESAIKSVSTFKDGYTGNAVMGGTGANCFSPEDSYNRQQAVVTIVRMVGVSAGGTSSSSNEGSYKAVSAAVESKVNALGADGTLSGSDIKAILDYAGTLENQGLVKNLVAKDNYVLYTTADGTPSGIYIDRATKAEDGEATLGFGDAEPPVNVSLSATNDDLYLKNNKVLFISSFAKDDATYHKPMLEGIEALVKKGYEVTVQNSSSLTQYANIGSGDYSMIFINAHGAVANGKFYFCARADESTTNAEMKYMSGGQVLNMDYIPVEGNGIYEFSRKYFISPEFFATQLKSDPLDDAYVQFISCRSMENQSMANAFLANGAKAVTGYSDSVKTSYAAKVLKLTAEKLSPAKDTPDGDEVTVGELETSALDTLGLNAFNHSFYDPATETTEDRSVITRVVAAGEKNMHLAVNNEAKPSTGTGLTLSAYVYTKTGSGFTGTRQFMKVTVTNNTDKTVNAFRMSTWSKEPTPEQLKEDIYGEVMYETHLLAPGASYTFETDNDVWDSKAYWIYIKHYWIGDKDDGNYQDDIKVTIRPEDIVVIKVDANATSK